MFTTQPADTWIVTGFGINCETETKQACLVAGSKGVSLMPISTIYRHGVPQLKKIGLLIFPGGFLDGDDLGCARACVNRFRYQPLPDGKTFLYHLLAFIKNGGLILGICNGFQLLVKLGLLPIPEKYQQPCITLTHNAHGRFENRWISLVTNPHSPCIFTQGLSQLTLPIRHSQGQLLPKDPTQLATLKELCPLYYCNQQGIPTQDYPENPNNSPAGMAALSSPNGKILGLMPHPEAAYLNTHTPTRTQPQGLSIFKNAYRFLKQK